MSEPQTHPHDFFTDDAARDRAHAAYRDLLARWPVPSRQHRVSTPVGETFVLECGSDAGPPLVLLSGSVGTTASWMREAAAWAPTHHLYLVDVPGEPGLTVPVRLPLDGDDHAAWLEAVLDGLGLGRVGLVGISLGGWLALDFAIRRPGRVDRLALIVPGGVGGQRSILWWALPLLVLGRRGREIVTRRILGDPPASPTEDERAFLAFTATALRGFRGRRVRLPRFSDAALSGLGVAVLAVVAGRDVLLDGSETRRRLEALVPDLELHWLPEARHFPGDQSGVVLAFLQRTDAA